MAIGVEAAGFIGASVTLVLVIIFMILMVILVRQCLQFMAKRNALRQQLEQQAEARQQMQRRRLSVTEPVPATFDWHHSIRVEGTPPPTYGEAETLPPLEDKVGSNRNSKSKDIALHLIEASGIKEEVGNSTNPLISSGFSSNELDNETSIGASHDSHSLPRESHDSHVISPTRSSRSNDSHEHGNGGIENSETEVGFTSQYTEFDSTTAL